MVAGRISARLSGCHGCREPTVAGGIRAHVTGAGYAATGHHHCSGGLAAILDDADALPRAGVERLGAGAFAGSVRTDDAQVSGHPEFHVHGAATYAVA